MLVFMPSLLRSFAAVIVGFMVMMLTVIALTLVLVKTMGQQSGHPTPGYLVANVVYSLLAAAVGGFVTAAIAASRPVRHAVALGGVIFAMSVLSYQHYKGQQPIWYQCMMMVLPAVGAVAGAVVYARNASAPTR